MAGATADGELPAGRGEEQPAPGAGAQPAAAEAGAQPAAGVQPAAAEAGAQLAARPDARPLPQYWTSAHFRIRRRAASIYGTIITAAIIAAVGYRRATLPLGVAIVITLVVYWIAEEYAEALGQEMETGRLPAWREIRLRLWSSWPMVSSSFLPLVVLTVTRLVGETPPLTANLALVTVLLLLLFHSWSAGRAVRLPARQQAVVMVVAAAIGVLMIVLKNLVLVRLH
jgi:hypothetical protein